MYKKIQDLHVEFFGKRIRRATISGWCCHGRHGVKLPALRVHGVWHSTAEDYRAFLEKTSLKNDAPKSACNTPRSHKSKSKAIAKAEQALSDAKI